MTVPNANFLAARRGMLEKQIALIDEAQRVTELLEGIEDNGMVVAFDVHFTHQVKTDAYAYVMVFIEGRGWFTTGPRAPKSFTSQEMALWLCAPDKTVVDGTFWRVAQWERV